MLTLVGSELATRAGISGVVCGATVLALASVLPEISTGIEAARIGDNQPAMGNVFGDTFQLALFVFFAFENRSLRLSPGKCIVYWRLTI